MSRFIRNVLIPIMLVLGYATLLSGGRAPASYWQLAFFACQSCLLTFLTCYVARSALYVRRSQNLTDESGAVGISTNQALSDGVQQLPCALLLVEAETKRLQFANLAAFKLFGVDWLPSNQLSQRCLDELFQFAALEEPACHEHPVFSAAELRQQVVSHQTIERPDGISKAVLVTSVPLFSQQGVCSSVMVSVGDVTEHNRQLKQIQEIAFRDPLTGLPNRLSILQRIQQSIDRSGSNHFALLFLDFDRFKLINDSLGHEVGDQLLIEIGNRISQAIRADDMVSVPARLGGDEFVILLDLLRDPDVASEIAERVLTSVNEPYQVAGHTIVSTASIGVVTSGQGAVSAADMLRKADLAMYKSKANGKARCSMFDESLKRQCEQRLLLENELRSALKFGEFDFDIQPILNLSSLAEVGGEALLRWQHPRLGRISANQFLEVACETGLIVPIGDQLLRKAGQLAHRLANNHEGWRLHVNISRLQLLMPQLPDVLDEVIRETGVSPDKLVFEVSESSVNSELERVAERLRELKSCGVRLCLDNFGSGASSLSLLRNLPLDYLKLDRSIVQSVAVSPESEVLLDALLTIGENYNIQVIAEGIECDSQRLKLLELGCVYGQGYAFQAPQHASQFRLGDLASSSLVTA